jgi:hypothetical protein
VNNYEIQNIDVEQIGTETRKKGIGRRERGRKD